MMHSNHQSCRLKKVCNTILFWKCTFQINQYTSNLPYVQYGSIHGSPKFYHMDKDRINISWNVKIALINIPISYSGFNISLGMKVS